MQQDTIVVVETVVTVVVVSDQETVVFAEQAVATLSNYACSDTDTWLETDAEQAQQSSSLSVPIFAGGVGVHQDPPDWKQRLRFQFPVDSTDGIGWGEDAKAVLTVPWTTEQGWQIPVKRDDTDEVLVLHSLFGR